MNCQESLLLLPVYGDAELDPLQTVAFERHVGTCSTCAARRDAFFDLRARIRTVAPYYTAPVSLRERVRELAPTSRAAQRDRPRLPFLAGAVAGCAATILAWFIATTAIELTESGRIERQVVDSHVQATQGARLVAVASTDRHTVKPWLTARLDYAPPVKDPVEGFTLLGGRVDALDDRAVAALVYAYRNHRIGVFVRPHDGGDVAAVMSTVRGFNVAHARRDRMEWWAVSDLNAEALRGLVQDLARRE